MSEYYRHYMEFVEAGVSMEDDSHRERLMLAGMGLGGEAGEVCDEAKKVAFHGKVMDMDKLVKELGDVLWYFTLMLNLYGLSLDTIMEHNVRKLVERYPHKHGAIEDVLAGLAT